MASHPLADLLWVVDSDTRHDLEAALQPEVLRAGDVLFRQGDPAGDVFFLRSGRLGVRLRTGRSASFRRHADLLVEPAMSRSRILDFDAWREILAAGGTSGREQAAVGLP